MQYNEELNTLVGGYETDAAPLPPLLESRLTDRVLDRTRLKRGRSPTRPKILLLVAAAAVILAGFSYASRLSLISERIPAHMEETLARLETLDMDAVAAQYLAQLSRMQPGDVENLEYTVPGGAVVVRMLRGETVDTVWYELVEDDPSGSGGLALTRAYDHAGAEIELVSTSGGRRETTPEEVLAQGEFFAGLEGAEYTPQSIWENGGTISGANFTDTQGNLYALTYLDGRFVFDESMEQAAAVEEVVIGGRTFVYIERDLSRDLFLYLGEEYVIKTVGIQVDVGVPRDRMFAAAESLVLYNEEANRDTGFRRYYDEAFFGALDDATLRQNAAAIARAADTVSMTHDKRTTVVWSQDGRAVSVKNPAFYTGKVVVVEFDPISYEALRGYLPGGVGVPFEKEAWFPGERFQAGSVTYEDGNLRSLLVRDGEMSSYMNIGIQHAVDPYSAPLDLLGEQLVWLRGCELVRVDRSGPVPFLIARRQSPGPQSTREFVEIVSAVRTGNTTISYRLSIDLETVSQRDRVLLFGAGA